MLSKARMASKPAACRRTALARRARRPAIEPGATVAYLYGVEYTVRFLPSDRSVTAASGTSLLEVARSAGLPVASACGASAVCARCGLRIVEGGETLEPESKREIRIKRRNRIDADLRLACLIPVRGDLVVTAPYW